MIEVTYDGSLEGLFAMLDEVCKNPGTLGAFLPDRIRRNSPGFESTFNKKQGNLFGDPWFEAPGRACASLNPIGKDSVPEGAGGELYEISVKAYGAFLHAWMSEKPIEALIIRFAWKVIAAARSTGAIMSPASRLAAERAINDREDPVVKTVLTAAYQVHHEIHRLLGFLRFTPSREGMYIAHCAPDHFILPGLAHHFALRFGDIPWAVIDEKRRLMLTGSVKQEPQLLPCPAALLTTSESPVSDSWEAFWRNYHQAVTNESRSNPALQRRFMPLRYWNYLVEMDRRK